MAANTCALLPRGHVKLRRASLVTAGSATRPAAAPAAPLAPMPGDNMRRRVGVGELGVTSMARSSGKAELTRETLRVRARVLNSIPRVYFALHALAARIICFVLFCLMIGAAGAYS